MAITSKEKVVIGRVERVSFPSLGTKNVPAKIDTGADLSAIWASHLSEEKDGLHVIFFGKRSEFYTGKEVVINKKDYSFTKISNSFGHRQIRYKIKIKVKIKNRLISATFTLADRSQKLYPILIGRTMLTGKFIVDVSKGKPLHLAEKEHQREVIEELTLLGKEVKE